MSIRKTGGIEKYGVYFRCVYDWAGQKAVYHCLQLVSDMATYPLNWFLTEHSVSPDDWNTTRALLTDVHESMAPYFDWMDADTRERALRRLSVIRHVVAYPSVDSTRETIERRYAYLVSSGGG
ncbi:hypothetical protein HPB52_024926 [Rhipicephalus sanguineus]|uniref:Uncharacterized protein n=1 Tax=Rhipicephalus sanguineus TaxID=34632 RepID=A0A9D4PAQ9_RHISA|nr:hypothetical protein HPB52_024926 [Rhipicephalus sanguineus]